MVNGTEIIYQGNPVSKALNKPIDKETLLKQMKKQVTVTLILLILRLSVMKMDFYQ